MQANHPYLVSVFFNGIRDGIEDGGFGCLEELIHLAAVWGTETVSLNPHCGHRSRASWTAVGPIVFRTRRPASHRAVTRMGG